MKLTTRLPLILLMLFAILALTGCVSIPSVSGGLVIGNNYRLESGNTLDQDLTIIGGNAYLEEDSTLNGDVALMGGNLVIDGIVNGDVSVMGGSVSLEENAIVRGSVSQLGGSINREEGAQVEGINNLEDLPFRVTTMRTPPFEFNFDPITGPLLAFFRALALAALAILVHLFAAAPLERVGQAAVGQAVISGGLGLLTVLVTPVLAVVLAITIILLPVSLVFVLLVGLAFVFGWLALGLVTGRHMARILNQNWSDPINAGVGTLTLSLIASMVNLIPCVGWLATFLAGIIGFGAVIVTRFGTQPYYGPATTTPAPRPPAPYTPPSGDYEGNPSTARIYDRPDVEVTPPASDPNANISQDDPQI